MLGEVDLHKREATNAKRALHELEVSMQTLKVDANALPGVKKQLEEARANYSEVAQQRDTIQAELQKLIETKRLLTLEKGRLEATQTQLQAKTEMDAQAHQRLLDQLSEANTNLAKVTKEAKTSSTQVEHLQRRVDQLQRSEAELSAKVEVLSKQGSQSEVVLGDVQVKLALRQEELAQAQSKLTLSDKDSQIKQQQIQELQAEVHNLKTRVSYETTRMEESERKAQQQVQGAQRQVETIKIALSNAEEDIQKLRTELSSVKREKLEIAQERKGLLIQVADLTEQLNESKELRISFLNLQSELDEYKSKIETYEKQKAQTDSTSKEQFAELEKTMKVEAEKARHMEAEVMKLKLEMAQLANEKAAAEKELVDYKMISAMDPGNKTAEPDGPSGIRHLTREEFEEMEREYQDDQVFTMGASMTSLQPSLMSREPMAALPEEDGSDDELDRASRAEMKVLLEQVKQAEKDRDIAEDKFWKSEANVEDQKDANERLREQLRKLQTVSKDFDAFKRKAEMEEAGLHAELKKEKETLVKANREHSRREAELNIDRQEADTAAENANKLLQVKETELSHVRQQKDQLEVDLELERRAHQKEKIQMEAREALLMQSVGELLLSIEGGLQEEEDKQMVHNKISELAAMFAKGGVSNT